MSSQVKSKAGIFFFEKSYRFKITVYIARVMQPFGDSFDINR